MFGRTAILPAKTRNSVKWSEKSLSCSAAWANVSLCCTKGIVKALREALDSLCLPVVIELGKLEQEYE